MSKKVYRPCEVESCRRQAVRRTYCDGHYRRWLKYGDPTAGYVQRCSSPVEAIRTYVKQVGDCLEWTGYRDKLGYGRIMATNPKTGKLTSWLTHRFAWTLKHGPISDGIEIDHNQCHNPPCINPDHLKAVTHKQNTENRKGAQRDSKSGIRGVRWEASRGKWLARVKHQGKLAWSKRFDRLEDAEVAVIEARRRIFTNNYLDRKEVA